MESAALLRSFHCSVGTTSHVCSSLEKPSLVRVLYNASWAISRKSSIQGSTISGKPFVSSTKWKGMVVSSVKTSEATETSKSDGSLEKKAPLSATFPNGFEVGDFEMHLKRNIGATTAPMSGMSPSTPPPVPTKPMVESAPVAPPPSPSKAPSPFTNVPVEKSSKLAALEASGSSGYVLVSSPTVGSFRRGRTVKGKKQPPICKEGNVIKEGQVIGYLDQFGTELPVKSDKAGEILKILFDDGEAVGYGDPLIALLPSFHGIK